MTKMVLGIRTRSMAVALAASLWTAGCTLEDATAPTMTAPSEFGLSVTVSASPDQLPRDGSSQSLVTVLVRDASGRPVSGQRLSVSSDAGTVSQSQVVTNSDGRATFFFIAPDASTGVNEAVVRVLPVGGEVQNVITRTVTILLGGTSTTAPTARFTKSSETSILGQDVVFDATDSLDEGVRCLDACTYLWDFGGEATRSGRIVSYAFRAVRTYPVRLTVTDRAGSIGTSTQNVTVSQGTPPTAAFNFSPTSPGQFQTVNFTAAASLGGAGRTIATYEWRFGDGSTDTGVTTSHAYTVLGTYAVTLTVTDSAGLKTSVTQNVTVVNGVVAAFNYTDQPGSLTVIFNAEESRGSDTGFGGRNSITKYIWHFGTDETLTETTSAIISKAFPAAGTYTVTLTVQDSAGRRQTTNQAVSVVN